jgi:hypothetical protein
MDVDPLSLDLKGSTQPELFRGTVDAMVQELRVDAAKFWQESLARNGPIEIWEINGERWLFNGNHRYQAAVAAGVAIPAAIFAIVVRTGSSIPTYPFDQMTWLPGVK